jgi:hypothetical protein
VTYWARKCDSDVFAASVVRASALCKNVTFLVRDEVFRRKLHKNFRTGPPEHRILSAVFLTYPSENLVVRHHAALRAYMFIYWVRLGYFPLFDKCSKEHLQAVAIAAFDVRACKFSRASIEYYLDKFCWEACPRREWDLDSYMLKRCTETLGRESSDQTRCLFSDLHDGPHHFRDAEQVEEADYFASLRRERESS